MTPDEIFEEFVKIDDPEVQHQLANRMYRHMRTRKKSAYGVSTSDVYTPVKGHPTNAPGQK